MTRVMHIDFFKLILKVFKCKYLEHGDLPHFVVSSCYMESKNDKQ